MSGGRVPSLAATAARLGRRGIPHDGAFPIAAWAAAGIQRLIHFLTDDIHQALEDLLHVDIFLGAGLEELETWTDISGDTCETPRGIGWAVASSKSGFQAHFRLLSSYGTLAECLSLSEPQCACL